MPFGTPPTPDKTTVHATPTKGLIEPDMKNTFPLTTEDVEFINNVDDQMLAIKEGLHAMMQTANDLFTKNLNRLFSLRRTFMTEKAAAFNLPSPAGLSIDLVNRVLVLEEADDDEDAAVAPSSMFPAINASVKASDDLGDKFAEALKQEQQQSHISPELTAAADKLLKSLSDLDSSLEASGKSDSKMSKSSSLLKSVLQSLKEDKASVPTAFLDNIDQQISKGVVPELAVTHEQVQAAAVNFISHYKLDNQAAARAFMSELLAGRAGLEQAKSELISKYGPINGMMIFAIRGILCSQALLQSVNPLEWLNKNKKSKLLDFLLEALIPPPSLASMADDPAMTFMKTIIMKIATTAMSE